MRYVFWKTRKEARTTRPAQPRRLTSLPSFLELHVIRGEQALQCVRNATKEMPPGSVFPTIDHQSPHHVRLACIPSTGYLSSIHSQFINRRLRLRPHRPPRRRRCNLDQQYPVEERHLPLASTSCTDVEDYRPGIVSKNALYLGNLGRLTV